LIKFTDDLITGYEIIDNQHKEMFNKLNDSWAAAPKGHGPDIVIQTLKFLNKHIITHFADEEKLQREISYPGFAKHKKEHEGYKKEFERILNDFQRHGPDYSVSKDLLNSMLEWVAKHIKTEDKQLVDFIQSGKRKEKLTTRFNCLIYYI